MNIKEYKLVYSNEDTNYFLCNIDGNEEVLSRDELREYKILAKACNRAIVCEDHLGNMFSSLKDMCEYHGVKLPTYLGRIKNGLSIEEALNPKKYFDHHGKEYRSLASMCKHYKIDPSTYKDRRRRGYSVEESLKKRTKKVEHTKEVPKVYDHLGNEFNSVKEMCMHYKVPVKTFRQRVRRNLSLEESLLGEAPKVIDHLGNRFNSAVDMCKYHNIDYSTYQGRVSNGWSIEDSLTLPYGGKRKVKIRYRDENGNEFHTKSEVREYYKVEMKTINQMIVEGKIIIL
jgi:hypothetical protein